jgi:hypothetical protein
MIGKWFQSLTEIAPRIKRVAMIAPPMQEVSGFLFPLQK